MSFADYIGYDNGKSMVFELLSKDITKEQAKDIITTFCILFDVEPDTRSWDDLLRDVFDYYNSWFDDFDEMDLFLGQDLC